MVCLMLLDLQQQQGCTTIQKILHRETNTLFGFVLKHRFSQRMGRMTHDDMAVVVSSNNL